MIDGTTPDEWVPLLFATLVGSSNCQVSRNGHGLLWHGGLRWHHQLLKSNSLASFGGLAFRKLGFCTLAFRLLGCIPSRERYEAPLATLPVPFGQRPLAVFTFRRARRGRDGSVPLVDTFERSMK
eukprot:scaffold249884_cov26-Tisochrysis_lutea.AAC.7